MEYTYIDIRLTPFNEDVADLFTAYLGEIDFDSFEQTDYGLKAYIATDAFDEETLKATLNEVPTLGTEVSYTVYQLEQKDWNEQWEQEMFDPVLEREFGIKLRPRMAFGSGSHETTHQITELLMNMDLHGQRVLDMGTGTGVLAIAMSMRGATDVVAIDIDEFSVSNTKENIALNFVDAPSHISVIHGDASSIDGTFDTIVANIHKNIIKNDLATYVKHLDEHGMLILSGFFDEDVSEMTVVAEQQGLSLHSAFSDNGWAVTLFRFNSCYVK